MCVYHSAVRGGEEPLLYAAIIAVRDDPDTLFLAGTVPRRRQSVEQLPCVLNTAAVRIRRVVSGSL